MFAPHWQHGTPCPSNQSTSSSVGLTVAQRIVMVSNTGVAFALIRLSLLHHVSTSWSAPSSGSNTDAARAEGGHAPHSALPCLVIREWHPFFVPTAETSWKGLRGPPDAVARSVNAGRVADRRQPGRTMRGAWRTRTQRLVKDGVAGSPSAGERRGRDRSCPAACTRASRAVGCARSREIVGGIEGGLVGAVVGGWVSRRSRQAPCQQ